MLISSSFLAIFVPILASSIVPEIMRDAGIGGILSSWNAPSFTRDAGKLGICANPKTSVVFTILFGLILPLCNVPDPLLTTILFADKYGACVRDNADNVSNLFWSNSSSSVVNPLLLPIEEGSRLDGGRLKFVIVLLPKSMLVVALANETDAPLENDKFDIPSIVPESILALISDLLLKSIPFAYYTLTLLSANSKTSFPARSYIFFINIFLSSITARLLPNIHLPLLSAISI